MLNPTSIRLNLSGIQTALQNTSAKAQLELDSSDAGVAHATRGAIVSTGISGDDSLCMYSENLGNHVRFYFARFDPDIDKKGNVKQALESMADRSIANFIVSKNSNDVETNEFFSRIGVPDHSKLANYFKVRVTNEYLKENKEFDAPRFKRFMGGLEKESVIESLFLPSPLTIHRLQVDRVKDGTPPAVLDVVETHSEHSDGRESFKLSVHWMLKDRSESAVNNKIRYPIVEIPIDIDAGYPLKNEIVQSYLMKINDAMGQSIRFKNNMQYSSKGGVAGLGELLKSSIPTLVEKNPPRERASNSKKGDAFALCYVAAALHELGYVEVAEGNMERQYRHFHFKQVGNSASKDVKVKFVDANTLDRVSKGYEELGRDPSLGIDVRKGKGIKGALAMIYHLSNEGVVKGNPATILKACEKHLGALPQANVVSLDSVSHSSTGDVYVAPFMSNKGRAQSSEPVAKLCRLRGLSEEVHGKLVGGGLMGVTTMKGFGKNPDYNLIVANLSKGVGNQMKIAQQSFTFNYEDGKRSKVSYDGVVPEGVTPKLDKRNMTYSDMRGAGAVLAGATSKSIVFSEAFIDMAATYDMTRAVGLNPEDFTFVSVQSAGNTQNWFSEATGGFRPATQDEMSNGSSPVMRDVVEETPIEDREMQLDKVRDFFDGFSKVIFLRSNTPENKVALNQFNELTKVIGRSANVNVYGDRGVYFKPKKATSGGQPTATFNESNFGKIMRDLGVKFDSEGKFHSCVNRIQKKVEMDASDFSRVRDYVVKRLGTDRLVMAYDADHAGMGQAAPFIAFLKALNLRGNVLTLPLVSTNRPDVTTESVMRTLESHGHMLSDVPFSPKDILNDMNEAVKFVNNPAANIKGAERTGRAVKFALAQDMTPEHEKFVAKHYETVLRLQKLGKHQQEHGGVTRDKQQIPQQGKKKAFNNAYRR